MPYADNWLMSEESFSIYLRYSSTKELVHEDRDGETGRMDLKLSAVESERSIYPRMLTIRQIARTGVLPEYTIRRMVANGTIRTYKSGTKNYINFDKFLKILEDL